MNIYGVRGYLTPDNVPLESHCRTFAIPNDVQWLAVFMGALLPLIYPENWQMYGELTPEESAEIMLNVIWDAYANDAGICPSVPTPFWDSETDVEDQSAVADQVWYGSVPDAEAPPAELDFGENVAIWILTGFVAYAGDIGAAIFFHTIAKEFVLSWKRGDVGEIFRIIVDSAEYGRVDTTAMAVGDIVDFTVVADPALDGHDLYIIKVS